MGVLKVLEEAGIVPDVIVGTSMGAVVGALYAQFGRIQKVVERLQRLSEERGTEAKGINIFSHNQQGDNFFDHVIQKIKERVVINLSFSKKSLFPASQLETSISELLDDLRVEDLSIKFAAMASDLNTGEGVLLQEGSLRKAVLASSSLPGFFPPVEWNDYLLIDGEATDLIPANGCRTLGADFVIAVDVRRGIEHHPEMRHTLDVFLRSVRITGCRYADSSLKHADFVFHPVSDDVQWSEFDKMAELVKAGEQEAHSRLPELQRMLKEAERNSEDIFFLKWIRKLLSHTSER